MVKYGRWVKIESVLLFSRSVFYPQKNCKGDVVKYKNYIPLKCNEHPLEGSPKRVLFQYISLGFSRKWFNPSIFADLVSFGFRNGYLKNDWEILKALFRSGASKINLRIRGEIEKEMEGDFDAEEFSTE